MSSNSQGGSDTATPQETQGWRGLHNPEQHAHVDGDEAWCFGCQGPKRDEGACYQFQPCRCCLTAEVEALRKVIAEIRELHHAVSIRSGAACDPEEEICPCGDTDEHEEVCRSCCTDGEDQTADCAYGHVHDDSDAICATIAILNGGPYTRPVTNQEASHG